VADRAAVIARCLALVAALGVAGPQRGSPLAASISPQGAATASREGHAALRARALREEDARLHAPAIAAWEAVLRAAPGDLEATTHLARLAAYTGELDRAVVRYREAVALAPDRHDVRSDLADVLAWMRRWDEAESIYEGVLREDPEHHEALKGLARLRLLRGGDPAAAAPIVARGLALYPGDPDLHRARGRLLAATGDLAGAADALRRAIALDPADGDAVQALAEALFRGGDLAGALDGYRRASALQPDSAHPHVQMARIHVALGHAVAAQEEVAAALRLSPHDPEAAEIDAALRKEAGAFPVRSLADAVELLAYCSLLPIVLAVPFRMRRALRRRPALRVFAWYVVPGFVLLNVVLHAVKLPLARHVDEALVEAISEVILFVGVGIAFLGAIRAESRVPELLGQVVLAVGAHPDDIELGTAGFLLKLRDSGARIHALTLSRGERGGDPDRRCAEATRALAFVGVDRYEILDFPDTRLGESIPAIRAAIEARIVEVGATLVLTHSGADVHGDHRAVHEATREAARAVPTVLCYEDVSTPQSFEPNYFVDVTATIDDHLKAIAFHGSQGHRTYMDPEVIRGRAAHRGLQIGKSFAMAFRTLNLVR
jgi:LmbE family N-acetylglucosaminyl deacetylase/tetratricopeptide (TPR) repeat protein